MTAYSQRNIRTSRHLKTAFSCLAALLASSVVSGCSLLNGPEKAEPPAVFTLPPAPVFDPADNLTPGIKLPDTYRVTSVISGDLLTVQGVQTVVKGTVQSKQYGVSETVRLAGIAAPAPGQPGWQSTVQKVHGWLDGKENITLEADDKYPVDLDTHRMVQLYFTPGKAPKPGEAPASGPQWNLNRMLIHTGYAVVDLYSATSIDIQKWLNDEEFAKTFVDPTTKQPKPLGLWSLGIVIPQRGVPMSVAGKAAMTTKNGKPGVIGPAIAPTQTSVVTKTTRRTSSTRNVAPAPNAPRKTPEALPTPVS